MNARALLFPLCLGIATLALGGCAASASVVHHVLPGVGTAMSTAHKKTGPAGVIKHIVVIIQENRSVDNLFNGFCATATNCANTVTADPVSGTPLVSESLAAPFDPFHSHAEFVLQYDGGLMDGFTKSHITCKAGTKPCPYTAFDYVPAAETAIYRQLATVEGELSDETFQTNNGPSFPAHYYAIAGQSGGNDADEEAVDGGSGTCGTTKTVPTILFNSPYPGKPGKQVLPCLDFPTIFDLLTTAGHSWTYYANLNSNFFSPTQSIKHLYGSPNYVSSTHFPIDVKANRLADVAFVIAPTAKYSDHPGEVPVASGGPEWVASIVNAVGESKYWNNTAIVIWWDDWGGFFDHVSPIPPPLQIDPINYGFRVPLIVSSPYAIVGNIDHRQRSFASALRLIEETFTLPSLNTMDQYEPDGLDSMFNFSQKPTPFTPLGGSNSRPYGVFRP
jgi:phospholipase C